MFFSKYKQNKKKNNLASHLTYKWSRHFTSPGQTQPVTGNVVVTAFQSKM